MKALVFAIFIVLISSCAFAQKRIDSLKHELVIAKQDTNRVLILAELSNRYRNPKSDSALIFGQQALKLAQKVHFPKGEIRALAEMGRVLLDLGNLPQSLAMQFKALQIAENNGLAAERALPLNYIGSVYSILENYPKALSYYRQSMVISETYHDYSRAMIQKMNMGNAFEKMNQLDSAIYYEQQAYKEMLRAGEDVNPILFRNIGNIQVKLGNKRLAMEYYQKSLMPSRGRTKIIVLNLIAKLYQKENQLDSSIYYARKGLEESELTSYKQGIFDSSTLLSELYEEKDPQKSFYYYKIAAAAKDSLFGASKLQALQTIVVDEQVRQRELEAQRKAQSVAYQNQLKQYAFLTGLGVLLLIAFLLYRNNRQKQKANAVLQAKNEEIQSTLQKLKSTQAQLIQSEKLASLGELTAGIAHEIQNPLNFVNNFSEMSVELAQELKDEVKKPEKDWGLIEDLAEDLSQNQAKINHHGKRASSIVSGMLEHSKASTGERALTDLNKLADEYLRLSYHGIRAKDNSFNSDYKTDFDENLPKIEVIPQDMGRVLLNLINNAFWAVKTVEKPLVTVKTERTDNQLIIKVIDNGTGMSDEIKAKIFQPFFTTKPTGQGTGLGLSLAYDIVTKGHGGTIEVESVEGEGATFVVKLPISTN